MKIPGDMWVGLAGESRELPSPSSTYFWLFPESGGYEAGNKTGSDTFQANWVSDNIKANFKMLN